MKKITAGFLLVMSLLIANVAVMQAPVSAADARNFNAGRIIDDGIFTNSDAMSVQAIQNFLNSKVPACDTWGVKPSELGGGTRAQWLAAHGYSTPVTCLRDYHENPANGQNNYGKGVPAGAISAAQIIYNYSKQFNINPQVIIVTLQKENGMVTDEWPTPKQFSEAMGFGCPDNVAPGAPACNPNYGSFSTQVYQAARHFRGYIDKPAGWWVPFTTGVNSIAWNPVAACGRSDVNIENRSTVALYSYTPYRPNQAALDAQYGRGNDCSAYGNRNFYLYFSDWFGSTTMNGTFLRTVDNPSLYLVSGNNKYPISDISLFYALYPLGGVGYVSQSYLDTKTTGPSLGRVIRANSGSVYFYDAGIKLPFGSCEQVVAYGSTCGQSVLLEDYQINSLVNGPSITNLFGTTTGKLFYITGGMKREVYDSESLAQAGISGGANVLNESALGGLPYGNPVMRNNVFVRERSTNQMYTYSDGSSAKFNPDLQHGSYLNAVPGSWLDAQSVNTITKTAEINGYIKAGDNSVYILVRNGKLKLTNPEEWSTDAVAVSDGLLSRIPTTGTATAPYTIVADGGPGTIYLLNDKRKRAITSWNDLLILTPNLNVLAIPPHYISTLSEGDQILTPGGLVKTSDNPTVYMVDGLNSKVPMTSFSPASELGLNVLKVVPSDILEKYAIKGDKLSAAVECGGKKGLAMSGSVYELDLPYLTYTNFSEINCRLLNWKNTPSFLLAPSGTIYKLENSKKQPISSYQTYINLGGNSANTTNSSYYILDYIQMGPLL